MILLKMIAAYRTVSFDAGVVLARVVPWEVEVVSRARRYYRIRDARMEPGWSDAVGSCLIREEDARRDRSWRRFMRERGRRGNTRED